MVIKRALNIFILLVMLFSINVNAEELYNVNFIVDGYSNLTKDIELLVELDNKTFIQVPLTKANNYSFNTVIPKAEAIIKIKSIEKGDFKVTYDKNIIIDKDQDYIISIIKEQEPETKEKEPETIDFSSNFNSMLNTLIVTFIALGIVGFIFLIAAFIRRMR